MLNRSQTTLKCFSKFFRKILLVALESIIFSQVKDICSILARNYWKNTRGKEWKKNDYWKLSFNSKLSKKSWRISKEMFRKAEKTASNSRKSDAFFTPSSFIWLEKGRWWLAVLFRWPFGAWSRNEWNN